MVLPFASVRLSAAREPYPVCICVQPFVLTRPSADRDSHSDHAGVPAVHLTRLSAVREAYPDRERASRSSLLACLPPRGRIRTSGAHIVVRRPHRPIDLLTPTRSRATTSSPPHCPRPALGIAAGPLQASSAPATPSIPNRCRCSPLFRSLPGYHSRMAVGTSSYRVRSVAGSLPAPPRSPSSLVARPPRTGVAHAIPASCRAAASLAGYRRFGRPLPLACSHSRTDCRPSADITRPLGSAECPSDGLISSRFVQSDYALVR